MSNNEFQVKLDYMFKNFLPIAGKVKTINELVYVLRYDDEVEDYNVNINSASQGFSFGMVKDCFYPTKLLALKIESIEYEEDEDSPYPLLMIKTN
jgi:hypothetical protein